MTVKQDKKNPGPSDQQYTKLKNPIHPRKKLPATNGSAGADQQFNKGESYDSDDGSAPATKGGGMKDKQFNKGDSYNSDDGSSQSGFGSSGVKDQQFDNQVKTSGNSGKLKKNTPGDGMNFNGQDISPAKMIMRAVGKAANTPAGPDQSYQGNSKVSSPKSRIQTKSYNNTTADSEQSRTKTSVSQKYTPKASESKKGSKT